MVELGNIEMSIGKMRDDNPENNYIYLTVTDTHGATVNKLLRDNYVSGLTTNGVPFLLTPTGLADYIKR